MNELKKIFSVIMLLTVLIFPQIVSAEKTDWADRNYNFRHIRTVVVLDLDNDANLSYVSRAVQMRLDSDYFDKSKKLKCQVLTENQARRMLGMMNASRNELKRNLPILKRGKMIITLYLRGQFGKIKNVLVA